jgi:hypothetical protein
MRRGLIVLCVLLLGGVTAALAANPTVPVATTGAASGIATTAATVAGTVNPGDAETSWQFQYGTSTSYGLTTPQQTIAAATTASTVTAPLSALSGGTTYHYRLVASNAAGNGQGADKTFKTASPPTPLPVPGAKTGKATSIGRDRATFTGSVDPKGQPTKFYFEFGATKSYGAATGVSDAGNGQSAKSVALVVAGLAPATAYHYRIVVASPGGTVRGGDTSFTTANLPLSVAIGASPDPIVFGNDLTISGRLSGTAVANQAVTLQSRPFPFTRGFTNVGTARLSDAGGAVSFLIPPFTVATQFRLAISGAYSAVMSVEVRPKITLRVRRIKGHRVRVTGVVHPGNATGGVSIQRRTAGGSFVPIKRVALSPQTGGARYTATLRMRPGLTLRAVFRADGGPLLRATSRVKHALG